MVRWVQHCWIRWQLFWVPRVGPFTMRSVLVTAAIIAIGAGVLVRSWVGLLVYGAVIGALLGGMLYQMRALVRHTRDDDFEIDIHARIAKRMTELEQQQKRLSQL